jgi:hypothetical protein
MNTDKAMEMAECVKINFKNLLNMLPGSAANPFTKIVELQIDECIKALKDDGE